MLGLPDIPRLKKQHLRTEFSGKFQTNQVNLIEEALKLGWNVIVLRHRLNWKNGKTYDFEEAFEKLEGIQFE